MPAPTVGTLVDGYRFRGGNPNDQASWEPVSNTLAPINGNAPGASYLPAKAVTPDKSEQAYYRQWRTEDPMAGNAAVSQARQGAATARRAEGLMAKQDTGGIYAVPGLGGVAGLFDPEIRELDAIQSSVARQNRQPGEGAISDFDAQQFLNMTYGKDKPTATNKALIQAQRVANDAVIQRRQFGEWYQSRFGAMNGFEEAWDRYSQDNPIFAPASQATGAARLNSDRQTWRQYFGAGGDSRSTQAAQDASRTGGGREPGWSAKLPEPQLKTAMRFKGSKAAAGSSGNPFLPSSPQEFKGIPKGAWVIDDDGSVFQKR